jgi:endoglucanase
MNKRHFAIAALAAAMFSCSGGALKCGDELQPIENGIEDIRINQIGYLPLGVKTFVVANTEATCYEVRNDKGETIYVGQLEDRGLWEKSGENLKSGNFADVSAPGKYTLYVADKGNSYQFTIGSGIYSGVSFDALKTYYYQRASLEIEEQYGGIFKRPLGQPDTMIYFHESTGIKGGHKSGARGWYDAGDFNKYMVNSGVTVGTMYLMYEMFSNLFPDNQMNIPESGNGTSDLLDEIKWNMDWVYTMQDSDGGVFVKMSELDWQWSVMPHEWTEPRYFIGKSTAASLNFAAKTAMASRIYKDIDPDFAKMNVEVAQKAWDWAEQNPNVLYLGTPGVNSGNYDDTELADEFMWAASEMYIATGNQKYLDYITANFFAPKFEVCGWRTFMSNIGFYSLISTENGLPEEYKSQIKQGFIQLAEQFADTIKAVPYSLPSEVFEWGSNSEMMNRLVIVGFAYELTKDKKYLDALVESTNYFFGKNATGFSFVTGHGSKTPKHPHHRQSYADGIEEPIPGFIVGGPNHGREDDIIHNEQNGGAKITYPVKLPATSYVDIYDSWASNEVTINWNASLLMVLSMIQANEDVYAAKK